VTVDSVFRIRAVFFIHAVASGGLYPRIPQIQEMLGVNEATLGLLFLGFPVGAISTFLFGSRVLERFGTRRVIALTIPALPLATALLGAISAPWLFFSYFVLYGVLYSLPNTALNVEADRIEAAQGVRIMNSCHGLWSVGYLLATLLGTVGEAAQLSPFIHMLLVALPLTAFALWVVARMDAAPPREHTAHVKRTLSLPTGAILLLVLFTIGPSLLEGALRNWSVIYMRDSFEAPSWVDTLTLPVFLAAHAVGRLTADRWISRWGVVPVARTLSVLALVGTGLVVIAPNLWIALLGFLLIGVGVCTAYPMTTSAAAQLGDRPATLNVMSLTLSTQAILLAAPAALGWVAEQMGIVHVFTVLLPAVALSIWLARFLTPKAGEKRA
jgi:MFS family permease